VHPSAPCF